MKRIRKEPKNSEQGNTQLSNAHVVLKTYFTGKDGWNSKENLKKLLKSEAKILRKLNILPLQLMVCLTSERKATK